MATELVAELRGIEVRNTDLLALNDRGGDAFLVFLSSRRPDREGRTRISDLQAAATRVEEHLNRKLARLTSPYLRVRGQRQVTVGFSLVFFNPLIMPERLVTRLVEEAWECMRIQKMQIAFQDRCRLQEILLADQIFTVFQPLVYLQQQGILGYEALSRGPTGALQSPLHLFDAAKKCDLVFELDRHCRRKAFQTAKELPPPVKLFVNVFPSSMYDPDFQGNALIRLLEGLGLSPRPHRPRDQREVRDRELHPVRGGAAELHADGLLDRGGRHRGRLLRAREDRPPEPALPEVRHAARARHRPELHQAGDGARPQGLRGQDGGQDHRGGHRAGRASARPAWTSASTSARATFWAVPPSSPRSSSPPAPRAGRPPSLRSPFSLPAPGERLRDAPSAPLPLRGPWAGSSAVPGAPPEGSPSATLPPPRRGRRR